MRTIGSFQSFESTDDNRVVTHRFGCYVCGISTVVSTSNEAIQGSQSLYTGMCKKHMAFVVTGTDIGTSCSQHYPEAPTESYSTSLSPINNAVCEFPQTPKAMSFKVASCV